MQAKMNFAQLKIKIWRPGQAGNFNISYWRWVKQSAVHLYGKLNFGTPTPLPPQIFGAPQAGKF
jgi:hypothetical protein